MKAERRALLKERTFASFGTKQSRKINYLITTRITREREEEANENK